MTFNDYQKQALTTVVSSDNDFYDLLHFVLGISGETGEITEKMKKIIRDKKGHMTEEDKREMAKETGDVLWYIAVLTHALGYDLESIVRQNVDKLQSRQQRNVIKGSGDNR